MRILHIWETVQLPILLLAEQSSSCSEKVTGSSSVALLVIVLVDGTEGSGSEHARRYLITCDDIRVKTE